MSRERGLSERALHWQKSENAFAELVELSESERARALEALSAEDPECGARVARLLAADGLVDDAFLTPRDYTPRALGMHGPTEQQVDVPGYSMAKGERVGPFRIDRPLGRGGMGEVFLARRVAEDDEESFTQVVAVKVIRPVYGRNRDELRQRFLRERRILARLVHPSIARLVDGGSTADGRPYLAMEFVAGKAITTVCREQRFGIARRLSLFLEACRAVQFAHENLVVHRDLKPSNVLVVMPPDGTMGGSPPSGSATGGVSVKLLDFGIAGWLDGFESELSLTRTGRAPATPDYAAPEQLRGEPFGTATDVFSLGILLFELLSGERPRDWPPSGSVPEGRTPPIPFPFLDGGVDHVPADLCAIVQRAIEEDPARRYGTVAALSEDLDRFQTGLPVQARQGNRWYRARKFAGRNRMALAASLILFSVVVAGLVGTLTQAARAGRSADRAERVTEFLTEIFEGNAPERTRGAQVTAIELLDVGAGRIARDLADEPLLRAEIETVLGRLYLSLGSYDQAEALLSSAVKIHRSLGRRGRLMVEAFNELAALRSETGDLEQAKALLIEAHEIAESVRDVPARLRSDTKARLGVVLMALGQRGEGLALVESAHAERLEHGVDVFKLAQSNGQLGDAMLDAGNLDRAEVLFREAVVVLEEATMEQAAARASAFGRPEGSDPRLAKARSDLGVTLIRLGRPGEALEPLRASLAARLEVFGEGHIEVAHSLRNLSSAERSLGNTEQGLAMLDKALAIYRDLFGDQHPDVAVTFNNLAVARAQSGDLEGAVEVFEKAVTSQRAVFGSDHPGLVLPLSSLGNLLTQLGALPAAERHLQEARRLSLAKLEEGHPHRALVAHNLAGVYLASERLELARPLLEEALSGFRLSLGDEHPNVGVALLSLGRVALAVEPQNAVNARVALESFAAASVVLRKAPVQFVARLVRSLKGEASAQLRLGRSQEASEALLEGFELLGPEEKNPPTQQACELRSLLQEAVDRADVPTVSSGTDVTRVLQLLSDCLGNL